MINKDVTMQAMNHLLARISLLLITTTLLGTGCASTHQSTEPVTSNEVNMRFQFNRSFNCDANIPAAPPCYYQSTPDGTKTTYLRGAEAMGTTTTVEVAVRNKEGNETTIFQSDRLKSGWATVGISDNGQFVHLVQVTSTAPTKEQPFQIGTLNLLKIDTTNQSTTNTVSWNGGLLDLDPHQNLMLAQVFDKEAKLQKIQVMDLNGQPLRTLYQSPWKEIDVEKYKQNPANALEEANIVNFIRGIFNASGSKVMLQASKASSEDKGWPSISIFDLSNEKASPIIPTTTSTIIGWQNDNTLLLRDDNGTSTYPLSTQ